MKKFCPFTIKKPGEIVGQECTGALCAMYSVEKDCCAPLAILEVLTAEKPKTRKKAADE